ncbi:MAG: serine hydrolase [Pseudanabaenaceae cyanobacterium]
MNKVGEKRPRRTRKVWIVLGFVLQWLFRLAIIVLGMSVIAGTLVAVWRSHTNPPAGSVSPALTRDFALPETPAIPAPDLSAQLEKLVPAKQGLVLHTQLLEVDGGTAVQLRGKQPLGAGGLIRMPILVALLQAIDESRLRWDQQLERESSNKISLAQAWRAMCRTGDNTATNLLIGQLGGQFVLNQVWQSWGLQHTKLATTVPDRDGLNTTSPRDLLQLLSMVERGKLLRLRGRDRFFSCLSNTDNEDLLPQGISTESRIWHQAGSTNNVIGDAGIIDLPNGKRYLIAVMVQKNPESTAAAEIIRRVSADVYDYLMQVRNDP